MSGYMERREEHHGGHRERGRQDEYESYGSQPHRGRHHPEGEDYGYGEEERRPQSYQTQGQGEGRGYGYAPPSGPPSSGRRGPGFSSQGGLDRGDFASDADIDQMISSGEFGGGQEGRQGYGRGREGDGRRNEYDRYDAPSRPPPGQGYGDRRNDYGRYDAPSGPPDRDYQSQQSRQQGYGPGGTQGSRYGEEDSYGTQRTQGRSQYEPQQGPPGRGREQGNAPSGGFSTSRGGEDRYGSGYSGPQSNDRGEPPYRGESAGYYDQQGRSGQGDRYGHLADRAREHGDDPEMYRQATQGLNERIQSQAQSRRPGRDGDDDYQDHVDAHRKAYGGDDHGPMDADNIGKAAAMEAFRQSASGSSNAPGGGGRASRPGRGDQDDEEDEAGPRGGGGGMQDKLMAMAMSQAGKLFDKKNAGSGGAAGDQSQGKAQAMQSAAATAMQMFSQYQSKGKVDTGDMMQLVSKLL